MLIFVQVVFLQLIPFNITNAKPLIDVKKLKQNTLFTTDISTVPLVTPKPTSTNKTKTTSSTPRVKYYTYVKVTHYCPCKKCNGNTLRRGAWGAYLQEGMVASRDLPRGTKVGLNGRIYRVEDKCARSGVLDIFISKSHATALRMGTYRAKIAIYY